MKKILINQLFVLVCIISFNVFNAAAQNITSYEYWLNNDVAGKTVVNVTPSKYFNLNESLPLTNIKQGFQVFNIRFKDDKNIYSSTISQLVFGLTDNGNISAYQYWFDSDIANAITVNTTTTTRFYSLNLSFDASILTKGIHIINIRFKDSGGYWSQTQSNFFENRGSSASIINVIKAYRYWFDTDISKAITSIPDSISSFFNLIKEYDNSSVPKGSKYLYYQFQDTLGFWSSPAALRLGPFAIFESLNLKGVDAFTVNFTNKSAFSDAYSWDFGDNTTSTLTSPAHTYQEPGAYYVKLAANNAVGTDTAKAIVYIKGLAKVLPAEAGNTGTVSLSAYGGIFKPGTTFILRKEGEADIVGDSVYLARPGVIFSTFDLKGKTIGKYDVIVNIPGDTNMTLKNGFSIIQGTEAEPYVNITGRNRFLANRWNTYNINYGNKGNVDANGAVIWIAITDDPNIEYNFTDVKIQHPEYVIQNGYDKMLDTLPLFIKKDSLFGEAGKVKIFPFYIQIIPAGGNFTAHLSIKVKTTMKVRVEAWIDGPMFKEKYKKGKGAYAACIASIIMEVAMDQGIALAGDKIACALSLGKILWNPWQNYQAPNTWGGWFLNTAVSIGGCAVALHPASTLAHGVGMFLVNSYQYYKNLKDCNESFARTGTGCNWFYSVKSLDPNEKSGPPGFSQSNYIKKDDEISYTIYCENKDTASAAAHEIFISDTLDITKYDIKNFGFSSVTIGDTTFTPLTGLNEFTQDLDMRPKMNIINRINARLDTTNAIINWEILALDPLTMDISEDPDLGVLPPNKMPPEGEASVSYTIGLNKNITHNDKISNKAIITFDANKPILTNEYFNTIDDKKPVSHIEQLNITSNKTDIVLSWDGTDVGSGIRYYDIYVLVNDTGKVLIAGNTNLKSFTYKGEINYNYKFSCFATDSVGNIEDKTGFDTETTIITDDIKDLTRTGEQLIIYPNPVKNTSVISYYLANKSNVSIKLYNIIGTSTQTLLTAEKSAGKYVLDFDTSNLSNGIYFIEFKSNNSILKKKIIVNH
ncbi:MAG: T9SS type A sorting domain-containing protein [Bacteroidales bacterium]|nr:T9SS type A sorting domain-containing protein [Bacteroidales bacterium]